MNIVFVKAAFTLGLGFCSVISSAQVPLYKQAEAPVEERVNDLLERMTLEEKVGQICCPLGWEMYTKTGKNSVTVSDKFVKQMQEAPIGSYWAVLRADPWTQKTLETGLNPELAAKALNALQKYAVEETRLGIPILFAEECPHGHMAIGTTVYSTSLGQASTWNRNLIYSMGKAIGLEVRSQGGNIGYGPVLDISREPRWSRVEETFGEDPYLTGVLGTEFVKGLQGNDSDDIKDGTHVYSTLKHLAAYGVPRGGHNGNPADIGMRALFDEYLPGFQRAVEEGKASTVMTSYNSIDGIPCTANKFLVDSVLRKRWGFEGFVYSDLASIDGIAGARVAADIEDAAVKAVSAGVDMDLGANAYKHLVKAVREGKVDISYIDKAVSNVLRLKFRMGLFENPYVSPEKAKKVVNSQKHKDIARQIAREGTVLLKNNGILPLSNDIKRIAVLGPNADVMYNYLGDYTAPQERSKVVTVLDAIKDRLPDSEIDYVKGCAIRDTMNSDIPKAVKAAQNADVVILVVGGSSARDFKTQYINTGAATVSNDETEGLSDMECGEGYDRATLNLLGHQEKLIREVSKTGKPLVVVYIAGRPLNMNLANEVSDALLTAWYPGEQGGNGIADVLFGDYNPSGRLPISVPRNEGQIPVHYSQGKMRDYMDSPGTPLFTFGYGLSYTSFEYSNLRLSAPEADEKDIAQKIVCTVSNTGNLDGDEVVQLYIKDRVSSVELPPIRLKGFEKVSLKKGESKDVTFVLTRKDLSFFNSEMQFVAEPGLFDVMIGGSSDNLPLKGTFELR